jgi:transcriptional regulator with XRE-family HTH domain
MKCGIDRGYYGHMERGHSNPSLTSVLKIADALGVRASEIHARAEQLPGQPGWSDTRSRRSSRARSKGGAA